jgi:hypothetical protein
MTSAVRCVFHTSRPLLDRDSDEEGGDGGGGDGEV